MGKIKEIKDIKIVSYTLLTSSVSAVLAFIFALVLLLFLGISSLMLSSQYPQFSSVLTGIGITAVVLYPIGTFLFSIVTGFISVLLYNYLISRFGGIKLQMDGKKLKSVPAVSLALILSIIASIWAFIIGLGLASLIPLMVGATNASESPLGTVFPIQNIGTFGVVGALVLIIGLPIIAFLAVFIYYALIAVFYNYIVVRMVKIQLNFDEVSDNWYNLTSIPALPAAFAVAILVTVFSLIQGFLVVLSPLATGDITYSLEELLGNIIGTFIVGFIFTAIGATIYNFLVPKLGAIKLNLQ